MNEQQCDSNVYIVLQYTFRIQCFAFFDNIECQIYNRMILQLYILIEHFMIALQLCTRVTLQYNTVILFYYYTLLMHRTSGDLIHNC